MFADRDTILKDWLARAGDPAGHGLREGLPVLLDEVLGGMDMARVESALSEIVKARAIQDCAAGEALSFIFALRGILRQPALDDRIDRMALLAFDLYMACREKTYEIKANEARRSVYVLERLASERA